PYIHIGGDEAPKTAWKNSDYAQQLIKKENLKDEHGLQSYFISRMEKYINSKGRNIIGWDEILEGGLAPKATVMSWRGEKGGIDAARQGHYVVMSPDSPLYFDHSQTRNEDSLTRGNYNPLEKVYAYNPLPASLATKDQKYILGAQGNVWAEYLDNGRKVDYMIFPRMSALAEALWTPLDKKDWNSFEKRLPGLMKKYDLWQTSYSTAYFDLQPAVVPSPQGGIAWELKTRYPDAVITYVKGKSPDVVYTYTAPVVIDKSGTYSATISDENGKGNEKWARQSFILNKATGKPITLTTQPNASYGGSGGFSLVDGIQNETGMLKSQQFLGFAGKDLEAVIDLGSQQGINAISLHTFEQQGSWIYAPAMVLFYSSNDGKNFILMPGEVKRTGQKNLVYALPINMTTRYIKVQAQNMGTIPEELPGAGSKPWLFADEITVE
ncbi:MAG: family 20 glycosylhydrolase, partial [Ferruginibacter sp.]